MTQMEITIDSPPTHALSIQSPFAFLIANQIKMTENRNTNCLKTFKNKWIAIQVPLEHYKEYEKVFDKNMKIFQKMQTYISKIHKYQK